MTLSWHNDKTLVIFASNKECLWVRDKTLNLDYEMQRSTYITGNTLGKTTDASARYSYRIRISDSSVVFRTKVA